MRTLQLKRYFLDIKERLLLEQELIEKNPELVDTILKLDDEEILERIKHNQ